VARKLMQPEAEKSILKFCVSGKTREEAFKNFPAVNGTTTRQINKIYKVAYWMHEYEAVKAKGKPHYKLPTFIRIKMNLHPREAQSLVNSLLSAGWKPSEI